MVMHTTRKGREGGGEKKLSVEWEWENTQEGGGGGGGNPHFQPPPPPLQISTYTIKVTTVAAKGVCNVLYVAVQTLLLKGGRSSGMGRGSREDQKYEKKKITKRGGMGRGREDQKYEKKKITKRGGMGRGREVSMRRMGTPVPPIKDTRDKGQVDVH